MRVDGRTQKGELASFTGLSTDDKPVNAPQGATYKSVDNGEVWRFNDGMWVIDITSVMPFKLFTP